MAATEMRHSHATCGNYGAPHRAELRAWRAGSAEMRRIAAAKAPVVLAATIIEAAIVAPIAVVDRAITIIVKAVIGIWATRINIAA